MMSMKTQVMKNSRLSKFAAVAFIALALSACSLPKRPAIETNSWMVATERTGAHRCLVEDGFSLNNTSF